MQSQQVEYVGFWLRLWALLIDSALVGLLIYPVLTAVYGKAYWSSQALITEPLDLLPSFKGPLDFLLSLVVPAIVVVIFWITKGATPGKMVISAEVVDAQTGGKPSKRQSLIRYLGYYVCVLTGFLGFFWVGFDPRKQGFHDKMAGTVVIRKKRGT